MSIPKEPAQVIKHRDGSVLGKKTILKSDHFPGCHNKRLMPHIDGAPNYRKADSLPVHGVAIPTIDGIRNVLKHILDQNTGSYIRVLWINLREEPVIYINSRPFVLRDVEKPFSNLEYTGIIRARVEQMEDRLKEDILTESFRYGNKILVTDELTNGQMVDQWEPVSRDSVKTPLEVYEELARQYPVYYERVPITDEKTPKEQDFDILVKKVSEANIGTEIVFNCQMGRGRTTTGMVIATLICINRIGAAGSMKNIPADKITECNPSIIADIPSSEDAIRRGEYTVIRSLIRVLEGGIEGKRQVDSVIDKCSAMQNLREAIASYRSSILIQADEMKRESSLSFFMEYLERYYFLICFSVYLQTGREATSYKLRVTGFTEWMRDKPELYSVLRRLLRRDPMGALGYASLKSSAVKNAESGDGRPLEMSQVSVLRSGEVLGSKTIIKSDHCPGCQHQNLPEKLEGAPNFREIPDFPVYGVAIPTISGIRSVIQRIGSSKGGRPVFWHNMREEPVVYINGKPFVLRELERPYKNMREYTGIGCERVERMEARLKDDILREAEQYKGAIMVIHETDDGRISVAWEQVNANSVQTPREVFRCFEANGYPIKYARVPITDGKAPGTSDFDTLASNISSASKDTAFVFNCQMGIGRTTTGTVIACLLKLRIDFGRPLQVSADACSRKELGSCCDSATEDNISLKTPFPEKSSAGESPTDSFGINDIPLLSKITRLFDSGVACREALDFVIDRCSALQNIRQAVLQYRQLFNQQHVEPRERRVALNRGAEYLERYFRLIGFAAYLGSEAFDGFLGQGESRMSFKNWLHKKPEVQTMKWSIRLRPGQFLNIPEELRAAHESQHGDAVMEATVNSRNGSVLGKGSILKMNFFPGQKTSSDLQIPGAPHVHKVDGYPVYSMATPTVDGAKNILAFLGAKSTTESCTEKVVLTDLREEAVVYISNIPFVLRELSNPVDSLKHVGITGSAVENMEGRLKEDVISEIRLSGGRMLLHREEYNSELKQAVVIGYWENVFVDDIKTPSEAYEILKREGYNIAYQRIPLTREREALASDVDSIQYRKDESGGSYLFISHTGFGGVAYAMAITCLSLETNKSLHASRSIGTSYSPNLADVDFSPDDATRKMGDYRDILSLIRVLVHGPESKADVDHVIDQCAGSGHLRDDILHYYKALEALPDQNDEQRTFLTDMGIKALRRYFFLIAFRSYLYSTSPSDTSFASWMEARPELSHLCSNIRLDK